MVKLPKIYQENPPTSSRNSLNFWKCFIATLEPENLESQPSALKTRIIAKIPVKPWATKPAHWIGQWRHQNHRKTYPNNDIIDQKPKTQNLKQSFYCKLQDFTSLQRVWTTLSLNLPLIYGRAEFALKWQMIPIVKFIFVEKWGFEA